MFDGFGEAELRARVNSTDRVSGRIRGEADLGSTR
jgi:hypothetical protein